MASANPELPAMYDARSVAMGGTGVAHLDGATGGVYFNPALLDGVEKLDVGLTVAPFIPMLNTPFAQPATGSVKQTDSEAPVIPLVLLGAAYRVHDRITVGLGAYAASGIGAKYEDVALLDSPATPAASRDDFNDLELQMAVFEAAVPVSFRLTDALSFGVAWRGAYATQSTTIVAPNPMAPVPGAVTRIDQDLSGMSFLGLSVGVRYQLSKRLLLGASYRSKMTIDLDGETDVESNVAPPMAPTTLVSNASTTSEWVTPHQLRAGASLWLIEEQLLLSLEGRVQLYEKANEKLSAEIDLDGQPLMAATMMSETTSTTILGWENAYTGQLGVEYWAIPMLALRAGFTLGNSATPTKYPSPFAPTPGLMYSVTAGLGAKWTHWEAGLAGSLQQASTSIKASDLGTGASGGPGDYDGKLVVIALSGAYRM